MGDNDDVILVTGVDAADCYATAVERATLILGTVPLVTLVSGSWDGEQWQAWYRYEVMFPLAKPHPEW